MWVTITLWVCACLLLGGDIRDQIDSHVTKGVHNHYDQAMGGSEVSTGVKWFESRDNLA